MRLNKRKKMISIGETDRTSLSLALAVAPGVLRSGVVGGGVTGGESVFVVAAVLRMLVL